MPPEYYAWLENLQARDTFALSSALVAAVTYIFLSRLRWRWPRGARAARSFFSRAAGNTQYVLPAIILAGLSLRLFNLGAQSLWYDEALSALTAQRPLADLLTVAKYSNHPPGYYLLLWGWSKLWPLGLPAEWWLRLPSALLGTANIGLVYLVARQFRRPKHEALVSAALMAMLPFQLFYSQEARMYALLLAASQVALLGYLARRYWLLVVGAVVMMYTQSMGALFLATLGGLALFDRRLKPVLLAGCVTALLYAPWAGWGLLNQVELVANGWIPQVTPGAFAYLWHVLLWGESNPAPVVIPGMALSGFIVISGVVSGVRSKFYRLVGLALGPPLLAVAASLLVAPVFIPRPLITATPALYILIAHSIFRGRRWLLSGLLAVMLAVALHGHYFTPHLQKWPHLQWAEEIRRRYQPGDAILYVSHFLPFWWYLPDLPTCFLVQDDAAPNAGINLSNPASAALGMKLIELEYLNRYRRVFVLHAQSPASTPDKERVYQQILQKKPVIWQHKFLNDYYLATGDITLVQWSDSYNLASPNICPRSTVVWDLLTPLKTFWASVNPIPIRLKPIVMPRPSSGN